MSSAFSHGLRLDFFLVDMFGKHTENSAVDKLSVCVPFDSIVTERCLVKESRCLKSWEDLNISVIMVGSKSTLVSSSSMSSLSSLSEFFSSCFTSTLTSSGLHNYLFIVLYLDSADCVAERYREYFFALVISNFFFSSKYSLVIFCV